jgi:hypothetical protein
VVEEAAARAGLLRAAMLTVDLPLRPREPLAELRARHAALEQAVEAARATGDPLAERDATAEVERSRRRLLRTAALAGHGDTIPLPLWAWQVGDVFLVAVPAEPYQALQTELRRRFPDRAILVSVVTNGALTYLLPRDLYGQGLYQDWVSVTGPGSLEPVIEALTAQLAAWSAA